MAGDTAAYYDANTRRFLRFGHGGASASIHRAVWAAGVATRREAMNYVDSLILAELQALSPVEEAGGRPVVVDLGCGVGGTVSYLEDRHAADYIGVTNSRVQRDLAAERAELTGSGADFRVDDYGDPGLYGERLPAGGVDLVYMIESFVHAADADVLLAGVAGVLRPGGRLVICDDVLAGEDAAASPVVEAFRDGWHIHTLITEEELARRASTAGLHLTASRDLTADIELNRPRDRVIRLIAPFIPRLGLRTPFWDNMYGGDALQRALLGGLVQYRYLVFEA